MSTRTFDPLTTPLNRAIRVQRTPTKTTLHVPRSLDAFAVPAYTTATQRLLATLRRVLGLG